MDELKQKKFEILMEMVNVLDEMDENTLLESNSLHGVAIRHKYGKDGYKAAQKDSGSAYHKGK